MYIVLAIIAFGILIAVHEAGHFFAAKACGVKVEEFALGMGPVILKKQGRETLYTLRLLPLGGFCAMEGEDEDTGDPRAFTRRKPWQRFIILCAGSLMNFILGFILVLCIAPQANFTEPVISGFMTGCPYEGVEGFMEGDRIYSIDGHRTYFTGNVTEYLNRSGERHDLVLVRDGKKVKLEDYELSMREYVQPDGSTEMRYGLYFAPREYGIGANIKYAWYECMDFVRIVWRSLGDLLTGGVSVKELSGPVGIVDFVNDAAKQAEDAGEVFFNFCYIFALIAVNLSVFNMLPVPALDGGRVLFLVIGAVWEKLTGRKMSGKIEGCVNTVCFVLLIGLMLFVMGNDIFKIFKK